MPNVCVFLQYGLYIKLNQWRQISFIAALFFQRIWTLQLIAEQSAQSFRYLPLIKMSLHVEFVYGTFETFCMSQLQVHSFLPYIRKIISACSRSLKLKRKDQYYGCFSYIAETLLTAAVFSCHSCSYPILSVLFWWLYINIDGHFFGPGLVSFACEVPFTLMVLR